MTRPTVTTAVIGAGPAGLLFCVVGKLLHARAGGDAASWCLRLYDKRASYARTHRLRMDPAPYLAMQHDVDDRRFDALIDFLKETDFTPEVNALESRLEELATDLGVDKELLAIGDGEGETSLLGLRRKLESEALLGPDTHFTIVAADSVHSVIREMVRGTATQTRHTHERVARVRVVGDDLHARLGVVDQYRLSKVLGSVVDYRLNKNGFAEVDLFLTASEHDAVRDLGATPAAPVPISAAMLAKLRAPLFRAIVARLEHGGREVRLQSTFQLEHTLMPKVVFDAPVGVGAHVFLVGDASISLPFFRGMACLAACAHSLARVHRDLVSAAPADRTSLASRYDREVADIKTREIAIVRSRARLVHVLREVVRISSLLPFPIQSWFLTVHDDAHERDHLTIGFFVNVALAATVAGLAMAGVALSFPLLTWSALVFEVAGGAAYRATLSFEPGPHRVVRRVWEAQIALALVLGAALTVSSSWSTRSLVNPAGAVYWLVLGGAFVLGIYAYERTLSRWLARAELGDRSDLRDSE